MIWIFPMAGSGTRTQKFGKFKPFIEINGKKIIHWALLGIKHEIQEDDQIVFTTTVAFESDYQVKQVLGEILAQESVNNCFHVILAEETPPGPAASVYLSKSILDTSEPCVVVNSDQHTIFEVKRNLQPQDGFLPLYFNSSPKSSYACIQEGRVVSIHEKELVSNYASSGIYGFGSGYALVQSIEQLFEREIMVQDEYYVGLAIDILIQNGGSVFPVKTFSKFDLGNETGICFFESIFRC